MCVFVTVVETAVAMSKETSRARLHSNMESLQAEGAIVACQRAVLFEEMSK